MAIVNINVSVTSPPKPSQLLKSGALVSTGGTTLAAGSYQVLTSKGDLSLRQQKLFLRLHGPEIPSR